MPRPPTEAAARALAYLEAHPEALGPELAREAGCSLRTARRLVAQHRAPTGRAPAPEGRPRKWAPRVPIQPEA